MNKEFGGRVIDGHKCFAAGVGCDRQVLVELSPAVRVSPKTSNPQACAVEL